MKEPPPLESWYGVGESELARHRARGALLEGARRLKRGEHYAAYRRLRDAENAVEPVEARRIRGLVHAAVAGVKLANGDVRGAERQLARARARLGRGAPTLAEVDVELLLELVEQRVADASPPGAEPPRGRV